MERMFKGCVPKFLCLQLVQLAFGSLINLQATCPVDQQKLSMEQIRSGIKPYVLGGQGQPDCVNCRTANYWRDFCSFTPGVREDMCPEHLQKTLLDQYLKQGTWEEYLTLGPCELWPYIKGRSLFIVGDSQAHQFFHALACFMFEFWDMGSPRERPIVEDEAFVDEIQDPSGSYVRPNCVQLPEGTRICYIRAIMVDFLEETVLPMLPRYAQPDDIVVMNVGIWFNSASVYEKEMHLLHNFISKYRRCMPYLIWMDSSMQHFNTPGGGFEEGFAEGIDDPWHCTPLRDVTFDAETHHLVAENPEHVNIQGGWRNKVARAAMQRLGIPLVETWNSTFDLWNYHLADTAGDKNSSDCTHFCHPSGQQVWMWDLYRTLVRKADDIQRHIVDMSGTPPDSILCQAMMDEWVPASQQAPIGTDTRPKHHHRHLRLLAELQSEGPMKRHAVH